MTSQRRVLLVDDDEFMRTLLMRMLQRHGFAVDACADAQSALSAARTGAYDLLVTDLEMEKRDDGYSVIHQVRAFDPRLAQRAVIITGRHFTAEEIAERAAAGFHIRSKLDPTGAAGLAALLRARLEQFP